MKNISFYLIHNKSSDRIHIRNRLQNLANKLNIDLIEIYKQKNNFKTKFSFNEKLRLLRIYFFRIFYNLKHKKEFSFNFFYLILKSLFNFNKSIVKFLFKNSNQNIKEHKHILIESTAFLVIFLWIRGKILT